MLQACKTVGAKGIAVLLFCVAISSSASGPARQSPEEELQFHADVPLGIQGFLLQPSGSLFHVMALAQNPAFEGLHQVHNGANRVVLDSQGRLVEFYPDQLSFRITATAWPQKLLDVSMFPVQSQQGTNDYLLHLRFRLKIFRGLQTTIVDPTSVALLGMPAEVSYNERIYGLIFDFGRVRIPLEDRIVLEVLTPEGERLCKFHLDLL